MAQIPNRILSVKVITDLVSEPVTTADVKTYGNITYDDYDELIDTLKKTARIQLERSCGRSFGVKTLQADFAHNGCKAIRIPSGEVDTITSLYHKPCHLQPYDDKVSELVDVREDPTLTNTGYILTSGDKFLGSEGYYISTYTTTAYYLTDDIETAIKAQTMFLLQNRDKAEMQGKIDPVALGIIKNITPGDLSL